MTRINAAKSTRAFFAGLSPYNGPWTDRQRTHLLRRTLFGVTKEDLDFFRSKSMNDSVESLMQESPMPPPPVNNYYKFYNDPDVPPGSSWYDASYRDEAIMWREFSMFDQLVDLMIHQDRNFHEKLILFWHNHIPIQKSIVGNSRTTYRYFMDLRRHAMGNFKDLVKAITLSPAMLEYLNGQFNTRLAPDENYARELQELFCVGKGPASQYTEEDVRQAARVLTGFRFDHGNLQTFFAPAEHDSGNKTFSAFYNHKTIVGKAGNSGAEELDELLDMFMATEESARFICRKIYTYFVRDVITTQTEQQIIWPLAQIFRDHNFDILPVFKTLFKSAHFYEEINEGAIVQAPLDLVIGHFRQMQIVVNPGTHPSERLALYSSLVESARDMGQHMGDPPNVSGWPAHYQYPEYDRLWINPATIILRTQLIDSTFFWGFSSWTQEVFLFADLISFAEKLTNPANPNELIEEALLLLTGKPASTGTQASLKCILLTGQKNDGYWTNAWLTYQADPGNKVNKSVIENRLKPLFQNITQLPSYHLI